MTPIDDITFNNLEWNQVDGSQLDSLLEGSLIIGAEPTDYPLTDAVIIYARDNITGVIKIIEIGTDPCKYSKTDNNFYIRMATLQA